MFVAAAALVRPPALFAATSAVVLVLPLLIGLVLIGVGIHVPTTTG
jgi:hypothetical protein